MNYDSSETKKLREQLALCQESLREARGWKSIDRNDLPKNFEKMSHSREFMLELYEMTKEQVELLKQELLDTKSGYDPKIVTTDNLLNEIAKKLLWPGTYQVTSSFVEPGRRVHITARVEMFHEKIEEKK